jgi:rhamnogalacturonyl hydrolase YesR
MITDACFRPLSLVLLLTGLLVTLPAADATRPDRAELTALMHRVAGFQFQQFGPTTPPDWKTGTFLTGALAAFRTTGDARFAEPARAWAEKAGWKVTGKPFHADDICVAQCYLELNDLQADPVRIADIRRKLEAYFAKTTIARGEADNPTAGDPVRPFQGRHVWWWADALYMAPPVLTRLAAATGDARYLELLHRLYWDTVEHLYVPGDRLFLRDARFFDQRTPGGQKIYWSRGNGWVYAGLVRILDTLPRTDPRWADYLKLFQDMTEGILPYQGDDGLWRTSLNEPSWYPEKESSGTSFFCFGLLAGVNRGWLSKERALAPALKAWAGLQTCVKPDGMVGYAQAVAEKPGRVKPESSINYTQGAFLLAASELYVLTPAAP